MATTAAPTVGGPLPWVRGGLGLLSDPTDFFQRQRRAHGDTFVLDAFGHRLFCVFSPEGIRSLYAQPEDQASFGIATYQLIKAKVPVELLLGRRTHPKTLFGSQVVEAYLDHLQRAVELEIARLGASGTFEIFTEMRRLSHRLGLSSWAGSEAASDRYLGRLIPLFDRLDSSESFVRPGRAVVTWATGKRREWAAMTGIEGIFGEIIAERRSKPPVDDFLTLILDSYGDLGAEERSPCCRATTPPPPRASRASTLTTTRVATSRPGCHSRPRRWSARSATACTPVRPPGSPSRPSGSPPAASSSGTTSLPASSMPPPGGVRSAAWPARPVRAR
jgi:hypothetical protein